MFTTSKSKKLIMIIMVLVLLLITAVLLCVTPGEKAGGNSTVVAGTGSKADVIAKPSNFVTARTTGILNGTLQKHPDGSVTFNNNEIASAEENLSQMYVILQGAGGAGENGGVKITSDGNLRINMNGGGAGAFALILVKFIYQQNSNGEIYFLPVKIKSGYGAVMSSSQGLIRKGADSVISIDGIGSISAKSGVSAYSTKIKPTPGGDIEVKSVSNNLNQYMEIVHQQIGKTSNENHTSHIFTVAMYKNGGWLTTRTFGTYLGGSNFRGGGASPYSRGGNACYDDRGLIWAYPEDAPSYGAGGGGTSAFSPSNPNCDPIEFRTGGSGGDGFIEILG